MTIIVPVAITPAGLPLPDPGDRATFSARKLEQLRWANNEYSTGSKALADASYSNALDSQASASRAQIDAASSAQNAALAATHAGATMWAPGTYALGAVVASPSTGWLFRKKTASSATSVDPVNDPSNWSSVSTVLPKQLITAPVTQAVAAGAYALSNAAVMGADTNYLIHSDNLTNAGWVRINCDVALSSAPAPYGSGVMYKLTGAAGEYRYLQSARAPTISGAGYWFRAHIKKGNSDNARIGIFNGNVDANIANVNCSFFPSGVLSVTASGVRNLLLTDLGNGVYEILGAYTSGHGSVVILYADESLTGFSTLFWGVEISGLGDAYIPTGATSVTRPAGVIAPQRIILPASPNSNDAISVLSANGSAENIIDPNGQQFYGPSGPLAGPLKLDSKNAVADLQFINGYWRVI